MTIRNANLEHPSVDTLFVVRGTHSQVAFFNKESADRFIAERTEPWKYSILEFVQPAAVRLQALRDARNAASGMNYRGDYYCNATYDMDAGVRRATSAIDRLIKAEENKAGASSESVPG